VPYGIEHLNGVWLNMRGCCAGSVAGVRKAAEGGEVAPNPAGPPGDVTLGPGFAYRATRFLTEGADEVSEGNSALTRLPVPDERS